MEKTDQYKEDWEYKVVSWSCKIKKVSIDLVLKVVFEDLKEVKKVI